MKIKENLLSIVSISAVVLVATLILSSHYSSNANNQLSHLTFKERHEERLSHTIQDTLSQFIPKESFLISVDVTIDKQQIKEIQKMDPNKITVTRNQETKVDYSQEVQSRPSSEAIKRLQSKLLSFPNTNIMNSTVKSLPGLPALSTANLTKEEANTPAKKGIETTTTSLKDEEKIYYYNQETSKTLPSETQVHHLDLKLVIDQSSLYRRGYDQDSLSELLQTALPFDAQRGDTLIISIKDFQGFFFAKERFFYRHQDLINALIAFTQSYDIYIVGLTLLALIALLTIAVIRLMKLVKEKRNYFKEMKRKKEEEEMAKKQAAEHKDYLDRKKRLIDIAEFKAESVAHVIQGWISRN